MFQEELDRITIGWSREQLARVSGVCVAAIYLLERMGAAGSEDDTRIQNALANGKLEHGRRRSLLGATDKGYPQNGQQANDKDPEDG